MFAGTPSRRSHPTEGGGEQGVHVRQGAEVGQRPQRRRQVRQALAQVPGGQDVRHTGTPTDSSSSASR
jgi:hypothetical protein